MNNDLNEKLTKLYYNPSTGLIDSYKLYKKTREHNINVTLKQIKDFLNNQYVHQISKQSYKPKVFNSIIAEKIRDEYQIDIMIYDRFEFHNYKYILCVIDIYSRFVSARPMTNREATTILDNIKDIFKVMGKPKLISGDNEFNIKIINNYFSENNIRANYSEPNEVQKNSIIERFNRTLSGYLKKLREGFKIYDWAKYLNLIIDNYNNTYHRTIKNTPYNIFYKNKKNNQDIVIVPRKFKINDKVRLKLKKKVFDKGDVLFYSKEAYNIDSITRDNLGRLKYHLNNDKIYSAKDLSKVSDIILYNPEEVDNNDEIKFHENKKEIDLNKKLFKLGISNNNLINEKRERKKRDVLDL
jgi:hypothetical protein